MTGVQTCALPIFNITDFGVGYRLGQWTLPERKRPLTLGVYAGLRYMHFGNLVNVNVGVVNGAQQSGHAEQRFNWADPMIGVQWSAPLLDFLSLDFRADIGGFGASSQLIWGVDAMFKTWLPWTPFGTSPYFEAGYRVTDFERGNSAGSINLQFRGPTTGMGFTF